jgi:hypothetical protein
MKNNGLKIFRIHFRNNHFTKLNPFSKQIFLTLNTIYNSNTKAVSLAIQIFDEKSKVDF